jgi:hypothetical protein
MADKPNPCQINIELNTARELLTRVWWNLYQGCLERGFNEKQSFALVQTYVLAQNAVHGVRPPEESGPKSDNPEA